MVLVRAVSWLSGAMRPWPAPWREEEEQGMDGSGSTGQWWPFAELTGHQLNLRTGPPQGLTLHVGFAVPACFACHGSEDHRSTLYRSLFPISSKQVVSILESNKELVSKRFSCHVCPTVKVGDLIRGAAC